MTQTALIFGDGSTAALAAEELTSAGLQVQISTPEETLDGNLPMEGAKLLPQTTPRFCRCTERGYLIGLNGSDTTREVRAEHVAVAMESVRVPLFKGYGLEPSPRVLSLSQAAAGTPDITTSGKGAPPTVLFLIGLFQETHPVITEQALRCALAFQDEAGFRCVVITGNLKVAADGLEALYRDCRSHGIWFVKRTSPLGDIQQDESGVVHVTYRDEVTREAFALRADLTVVDEDIVPSPALSRLAEVLELEKDSDGFVQADNVHRLPVYTNRKNIWIIGPSRAILGPEAVRMDVAWLAREAGWKAEKQQPPPEDRAQIDTGLCVRCLTCHRLCPYRAVTIGSRMTVDPHRCERCGICAAECPALAIRIPGVEPALLPSRPKDRPGAGEGMPSPEILAFGCAR
ncbi:MAG: 4Fe-4S binding protein, partial [Desulfobacteraceae bacterium]|nr:4Fe-4S binding protein [Desulfobacteraceae bacterium]